MHTIIKSFQNVRKIQYNVSRRLTQIFGGTGTAF